jgi:Protein of unknown function (DUF3618)
MAHSEQLERDTQSCRDQLADTLDELRARMSPGEVVDQLVDYAQDTTGGLFFQHLKQQVANNPLPVAVMAAGFAWLMFGKGVSASNIRQSTASVADSGRSWLSDSAQGMAARGGQAADRLSEVGSHASDATGSMAADARERMRAGAAAVSDAAADAASRAKETMSDATAQVKDAAYGVKNTTERLKDAAAAAGTAFGDTVSSTYDRAAAGAGRTATAMAGSASRIGNTALASGRDFMDFCRDQPLVLAGIGLAVGAAIGALLPRTKAEDELMGEASDELKEQTKEFAGQQFEKAKKVGERAYATAKEEVERQDVLGEGVADEVRSTTNDTSIAPTETDARSDKIGEIKPQQVHERH